MQLKGTRILVTGGMGFIGSSIALRLWEEGAEVTVLDSAIEGCGANEFNLAPAQGAIRVLRDDIANVAKYATELTGTEIIFNIAGEISHLRSMQDPARDLAVNTISQLQFLLGIRTFLRGVRIVYASTRQVYGVPEYLPIDERHPLNPIDFNGAHKLAATHYHSVLTQSGDIDAIVLRLTNTYGPRMALHLPAQGFLGQFLRQTLLDQDLEVFGDGNQLRDPVYIDDMVDIFLLAALHQKPRERVFNVGGGENLRLLDIASELSRISGASVHLRSFPAERAGIDIGSYATNSTRIRTAFDWKPKVSFAAGARLSLDYFRENAAAYLPRPEAKRVKRPVHTR